MSAPYYSHNSDEASDTAKTPAIINNSWRFSALSAADLLPILQHHLKSQDPTVHWQLVWLNNDGCPVIGLLPKTSWSVYSNADHDTSTLPQTATAKTAAYKVIKNCRDSEYQNAPMTHYMSYSEWQDELINYSNIHANSDADNHANSDDISPLVNKAQKPVYNHGLIGFIGYDIAAHELSPAATISQASQLELQPCAVLGHYDIYLTLSSNTISEDINSNERGWQLNIATCITNNASENKAKTKIITALILYLDELDNELSNKNHLNKAVYSYLLTPLNLSAQWHKNTYQQAFAQTQRYLVDGDCYQINLTQAWQGRLINNDLIDYLPNLHRNTHAPFAGYLSAASLENNDSKTADFELLSCSPELFFTFTKDYKTDTHHIITKPIKGTMPRGNDSEQDSLLKQGLLNSEKDRSENVMIVDLLRNDLGKYAKTGSVKVPQLFNIESFSNVHHMVSTITAELKKDSHPLAVLFGSLPAGSITGAPKKRAVEIIAELEVAARGAYCGTLGYMNFDGSGQWNVLIRTLQANGLAGGDKEVSLWAGGGITIASDCDAEYQECLDKVGNLLGVLQQ